MEMLRALTVFFITAIALTANALAYPIINYFSASANEINQSDVVLELINESYFEGVTEIRYYTRRFGDWFGWMGLFIPYSNIILIHSEERIHIRILFH